MGIRAPNLFVRSHLPFRMLDVLAATGALLCAFGCSRENSVAPGVEKHGTTSTVEQPATAAASAFAASVPQAGGVAGYAGSQACRSCHEDQFASWHRSYHRTMTQFATADSVQADFRNVALTNDGVRFVLSQ